MASSTAHHAHRPPRLSETGTFWRATGTCTICHRFINTEALKGGGQVTSAEGAKDFLKQHHMGRFDGMCDSDYVGKPPSDQFHFFEGEIVTSTFTIKPEPEEPPPVGKAAAAKALQRAKAARKPKLVE